MRKFYVALISTLTLVLSGCAPSSSQLKKAIEDDPSIVFSAIEKDPEKFFEVVNRASQGMQKKAQEKQLAEENASREKEFQNPLKPELGPNRVYMGNKDAKVTIVEYSDFECPYCARGYNTMNQVKAKYGDKVRILFKHLPLDFHPKALPAAKYYEAIALQDHQKAIKFHNMVFENQGELKAKGEKFLDEAAKKVGADLARLKKDLNDSKIMDIINADMKEAAQFGFSGTPGYIVNGVSVRGAYPLSTFEEIIDRHLSETK